ncbi:unnamed protein product [marine sediment metagenome]|uniref:Uncharacterized protein n=1 Tax=marine sediment metagenome TaxID=412755 RepID=X1HAP8_9ZZZZ
MGKILYLFIIVLTTLPSGLMAQSPLCASSPTTFGYEYVSSVSINGVSRAGATGFSGPGYFDYTGSSITSLVAGNTYPMSVTVKTNNSYKE